MSTLVHGKRSSYMHGCRCHDCTLAQAEYCREWQRLYTAKHGRRYTNDQDKRRGRRHGERIQRRALMQLDEAQSFDPALIYERDGWVCQLCGVPVNREAAANDNDAASIDHVIPVSRGGAHTVANCQCAHRSCNSAKGARVPGGCLQ
jgi:5-methylcytosine-specific restriction endonuclease McrA